MVAAVLRVTVTTGTLVVVYATAPIGQRPVGTIAARLFLALLVLAAVLGWQFRSLSKSRYPTLRGVEAVAVSVPLLVLTFATTYFSLGQADPASFTEPLSRIDAAYFAVTVLSTVGFGDITPTTETARLLVTLQMGVDLVLIGFIAKVLVGAIRRRREALGRSPL